MKTQLLCTFTPKNRLDDVLELIIECNDILYSKIYVFQNGNDSSQLICTYNVDLSAGADFNDVKGTISLHRKKHTNTLYTINALNEVIADLNNGVVDSKFIVPWENFQNTLLVTNSDGLNRINTRIYKIIKID